MKKWVSFVISRPNIPAKGGWELSRCSLRLTARIETNCLNVCRSESLRLPIKVTFRFPPLMNIKKANKSYSSITLLCFHHQQPGASLALKWKLVGRFHFQHDPRSQQGLRMLFDSEHNNFQSLLCGVRNSWERWPNRSIWRHKRGQFQSGSAHFFPHSLSIWGEGAN